MGIYEASENTPLGAEERLVVPRPNCNCKDKVEFERIEQDMVEVAVVVLGGVERTVQVEGYVVPEELRFLAGGQRVHAGITSCFTQNMVDSSVYALVLAFAIDLAIFVCILISFPYYKNVRSRKLTPPPGVIWPKPTFFETEYPLMPLCRKVYNVTKAQFQAYCKPEGSLYLNFTKDLTLLLTGVGLVGCFVLVPLYAFGKENPDKEMDKTSFANISDNDKVTVVICFICLLLFSLIYYYFAYRYFREARESYTPSALETYPIHECGIQVLNIPFRLRPEEFNDRFRSKFNSILPGGVFDAFLLPDYEQLHDEYLRLLEVRERIKHYQFYEQINGSRAMIRVALASEKVDAINYYEEQEIVEIQRIKAHRVVGTVTCCGYGFVICNSPEVARKLMAEFHTEEEDEEMESAGWVLSPAPDPRDILWENMGSMPLLIRIKKYLITALFVLLFFILMSPPTVLALFGNVLSGLGLGSIFTAIMNQFLPTLLIFLYQRVLIPEVIKYLVNREHHVTNSELMKSRLEKYMLFSIIFIFLVPFLGLQVITFIYDLGSGNYDDWNANFVERTTLTGQFFSIYMIHMAFLSNGGDLLQLFKLVKLQYRLYGTITEEEKMKAFVPDRFNFPYHYSMSLTSLTICMTFSVVYPLIVPICVLYFVIRVSSTQYWVHKYNMLCFYYVDQVTIGAIGQYALTYYFLFILFFQLVTCGLLMLNGGLQFIIAGGVCMGGSVLIFIVFTQYREDIWRFAQEKQVDSEPDFNILRRESLEYKHLIDRDDSWLSPMAR